MIPPPSKPHHDLLVPSSSLDISIVMAYYNRKPQTLETLKGFERSYADKHNFEVVIVDDNSNAENRLEGTIKQFSFPIKLIVVSAEEKGDRVNPCIAYNRGFAEATGNIIIIQNPECYHVGDVVSHALNNLGEQDYFSYSCFSANSPEISTEMVQCANARDLATDAEFLDKNFKLYGLNWYNHPTAPDRSTAYHFCSCIHRSKLALIGGFDKRFGSGYCYDDDELLLSVKHNLRLNVTIVPPEPCMVVHQYHTRNAAVNCDSTPDSDPIKRKWLRNKRLFEGIKAQHDKRVFQYPKLVSLYWDGSPLSYLNYLTVVSFNHYNPGWKIVVWVPTKRTATISWKGRENKLRYKGPDHFHRLHGIPNVTVNKVSLDSIGFNNNHSEVIKSDYLRYYVLHKHGGLWSDFDILYTGSVEEKMSFAESTVIFKCPSRSVPRGPIESYYFPIGFLMCMPNNVFFSRILEECHRFFDPKKYQSIGANMWKELFLPPRAGNKFQAGLDRIRSITKSIAVCSEAYYLPFAWNQLGGFLGRGTERHGCNELPRENIGIHWFNGADRSKRYAIELEGRLNNFQVSCFLDKLVAKYV